MKKAFVIFVMLLLTTSLASAYIIPLEQKINVTFTGPNGFVLTNENGIEQPYVWTNGTTHSDDVWSYTVYRNLSTTDICSDNTAMEHDIKDSYQSMIDVLAETQKVYSDQKNLSTELTTCKSDFSECDALRQRYLDESNKNVADATKARRDLETCQSKNANLTEEKNSLEARANRVTTLSQEKSDLEKDVKDAQNKKNVWGIIGLVLGALAFYGYQKYGGKDNGERPSDEGGF